MTMLAPSTFRAVDPEQLAGEVRAENGAKCLSRTVEERLNALRQVERALCRVGRHIAYSQGDRHLQAFWCGVKRDFEEEAHRLALELGEVATRLSPIDSRPERGAWVSRAA